MRVEARHLVDDEAVLLRRPPDFLAGLAELQIDELGAIDLRQGRPVGGRGGEHIADGRANARAPCQADPGTRAQGVEPFACRAPPLRIGLERPRNLGEALGLAPPQ